MKVYAPGKLILSGEHAVLYGQPALAMAINHYACTTITPVATTQLAFHLTDFDLHQRLSIDEVHAMRARVEQQYDGFKRGEHGITDVLQHPLALIQVVCSLLAATTALTHGFAVQIQSTIPIGAGMGSSAAIIVSVMRAMTAYLSLPVSAATFYELALRAENMQHGHSSGFDLRVSLDGGCLYKHQEGIEKRALPTMDLHLVQTGAPLTTTGECVEQVASYFHSPHLGEAFGAVTKAMDAALQKQSVPALRTVIMENHRLLNHIGVVPLKIQQFIAGIERAGGAAKICGAGAVAGDTAGALLVMIDDKTSLAALCARYGYEQNLLSGETRGVYAA